MASVRIPMALNVRLADADISPGDIPEVSVATAVRVNPAAPIMALGSDAIGPQLPPQLPPQPVKDVDIYRGPHSVPDWPLPVTAYPFTETMLALTMVDVSSVEPTIFPKA